MVVVLGQRQNGQNRLRLVTGGPHGDCKVRLPYQKEEEDWTRRKAPPPTWTSLIAVKAVPWTARNKELEELQEETGRVKNQKDALQRLNQERMKMKEERPQERTETGRGKKH